ncbi:MAG: prepilin-type N-terminal cleavage/methylation domain-containing protein [Proteobacteria bacterium]|jgi:general secretion pathway protein G|nr:prepilin-type N-terminal cleavage/methylation domain-containing protein [Pseudomonadota bacterium]
MARNNRKTAWRRRHNRRGMSLVEIMVVIAIILTLMSIIGYGVMQVFENSRVDTSMLQMGKVAERVEIYTLRHKKPPTTSQGLKAVYGEENPPSDSWGNEIVYVSPGPNGMAFDLISHGADGTSGGNNNSADLKWSEIKSR